MKPTQLSMDFSFDEPRGILIIRPPQNFEGPEKLEHARQNLNHGLALVGDQLKGILAFLPTHYVNTAATAHYKKNVPEVPVAMVASSFFERMIGKFMLSLSMGQRSVKLFSTEDDGRKWLEKKVSFDRHP